MTQHNAYAVSCAGAALDECHRWENAELTQAAAQTAEGSKKLRYDTDPRTNPAYVDHQAELRHYAKEVQMQLERLRSASAQEAVVAWRKVVHHQGRHGVESLVRIAVAATARIYPRAGRILSTNYRRVSQ